MFVYCISPMDFGWNRLPTIKQAMMLIIEDDELGASIHISALSRFVDQALSEARKAGWEGDYRPGCEPRVCLLPSGIDPEPLTILVWKQDNNGETFVVSPVKLPHLDPHNWR